MAQLLRISWVLPAVLALGCGGATTPPEGDGDADADADGDADQSAALFDPEHILEVEIELAEGDWDLLRVQSRNLVDVLGERCMSAPFASPFTYFPGTVTVDGHRIENAGVRKKGFLGSLDPIKPSLRVKFDEYEPGVELFDEDGLTLNNARQDPSYLHQCLSYAVFAEAGVPAPRCSFAHVTVDGEDLGLYVNVERVGKRMLRHSFADDGGNLYEGTLSDFRSGWTATFEKKTNEIDADRGDLDAVVAALDVPDGELVASLGTVLDVDGFVRFWAAEVLLNHWDGYAGNTNNFFVYDDPVSGLFHFVPWGTDGTMVLVAPGIGGGAPGTPTSVFANSALTARLYAYPPTRDQYVSTLRGLLDTAFDENALLDETDRMEALVGALADPEGTGDHAWYVEDVRDFVRYRAEEIEDELADGPRDVDPSLREPICFDAIGHLAGTFDTRWGTIDASDVFASGEGTLDAELDGEPVVTTDVGSKAGWDPNASPDDPRAQVQVIVALPDGTFGGLTINIRPQHFTPGADLPVDWDIVFGAAFHFTPLTGAFVILGALGDGTVHLDEAGLEDGQLVVGSFDAALWGWPF